MPTEPYKTRHEGKYHYVDGPDAGRTHGTVFFDHDEHLVKDIKRLLNIAFEEGRASTKKCRCGHKKHKGQCKFLVNANKDHGQEQELGYEAEICGCLEVSA